MLCGGFDGSAGVGPEDEEVYSKPFGNCRCLGVEGLLASPVAEGVDLAGVASGCVGEFADADFASVSGALHEHDQSVRAHEDHVFLLGTHLATSVDAVCVSVNKNDSTCL